LTEKENVIDQDITMHEEVKEEDLLSQIIDVVVAAGSETTVIRTDPVHLQGEVQVGADHLQRKEIGATREVEAGRHLAGDQEMRDGQVQATVNGLEKISNSNGEARKRLLGTMKFKSDTSSISKDGSFYPPLYTSFSLHMVGANAWAKPFMRQQKQARCCDCHSVIPFHCKIATYVCT